MKAKLMMDAQRMEAANSGVPLWFLHTDSISTENGDTVHQTVQLEKVLINCDRMLCGLGLLKV